jgi:hypothetical protein
MFPMEGMAMLIRTLLIAATALGTAASAEPVKPADTTTAAPKNRPAEVLLASAEQVPALVPASTQDPAAQPVKRPRAARVTTCRCANQAADNNH